MCPCDVLVYHGGATISWVARRHRLDRLGSRLLWVDLGTISTSASLREAVERRIWNIVAYGNSGNTFKSSQPPLVKIEKRDDVIFVWRKVLQWLWRCPISPTVDAAPAVCGFIAHPSHSSIRDCQTLFFSVMVRMTCFLALHLSPWLPITQGIFSFIVILLFPLLWSDFIYLFFWFY